MTPRGLRGEDLRSGGRWVGGDPGAGSGAGDQPAPLESGEGLPQRRPADPETVGQLDLRQDQLTRLEPSIVDDIGQEVLDLSPQRDRCPTVQCESTLEDVEWVHNSPSLVAYAAAVRAVIGRLV